MSNKFIIEKELIGDKEVYWAIDPVTTERKMGCDEEEARLLLQSRIDWLVEQRKEEEKPLSDFEQDKLKIWLDNNFLMLNDQLKKYKIIFDNEFKELNISVFVNHFNIVKEIFKKKNIIVEKRQKQIKGFYRYCIVYNYNSSYVDDLMDKYYL